MAYSMIKSHQEEENYSMHPVVHDWCAQTMSRGRENPTVRGLRIVGAALPDHSRC